MAELERSELEALTRCMRDLVALSALSAAWSRSDTAAIAGQLALVVARSVPVEFSYVCFFAEEGPVELACLPGGQPSAILARKVATSPGISPMFDGSDVVNVDNPAGEGTVTLAQFKIGCEGECGFIAVGSQQPGFPSTSDRLLLGVAANQAAVVLQQRRLEGRLRRNESELTDFFENATVGLHWVGPDGSILRANEAELRMLGYSKDEYIGRHIAEFHVDQALISELLDRLARGETVRSFEAQMRCKDGTIKHVLIDSSVMWDEGRFIHTRCFTQDISGRRRVEQTTRFLADASATLAELSDPDEALQKIARLAVPFFADWCAVDMLGKDGALRRVAVTHSDPEKVRLAAELFTKYPPRPDDSAGVMKVLRTGEIDWLREIPDSLLIEVAEDEEHLQQIRQLGLRSYLSVPLGRHGNVTGVITFAMAESGRRYETDDVLVAVDLAYRSAVAIENAALYDSLREADRRKDEFLATLAHELRNPLGPIRNGVEFLRLKGPADPSLVKARDVIDRQTSHMTRLVEDLLDLSRITLGKIALQKEPACLQSILANAVDSCQGAVDDAQHELTLEVPPDPITLDGDVIRLTQVFSNLIANAAKYTESGGRIWVSAALEGETIVVSVRDTGIGISADHIPKLFEMFSQAEPALKRSQGGLGIGLALARGLVEMHGGTIEAQSQGFGQGSEFTVRLPCSTTTGSGIDEVQPSLPKAKDGHGKRILVVDDNRDAAESLVCLLQLQGHETMTAYDGLQALELAETFAPDIIFLDIGLPKLDGYNSARYIRQSTWGKKIVLVALTGWGQEADKRRALDCGFDHHITKPLDPKALQQYLHEFAS